MVSDPRPLTRDELAKFLPTQRAIRAFEKLFELVPGDFETLAILVQEVSVEAGSADARAQQALDSISRLADAVELLALAPRQVAVTSDELLPVLLLPAPADDLSPPVQIGTLGQQQADRVEITGGVVTAQLRNNQTILLETTAALTDGAAALAATMLNSPVAGDPSKWVAINDNGTTRYIPTW